MRYRITNLTRTDDSSKTTGTHAKPATFDIDAVNEAVAHAAARGESLYIRPIAATAAAAPPVPPAVLFQNRRRRLTRTGEAPSAFAVPARSRHATGGS
ncbi:hypothetical protein [Yinghuangia soli]|uniref:Uncharacterized protein n=1 Tax=Yinghuangia soli TaxID=2908204 RepID=A0AA41U3L8_9ACTN|nr:hypothetical protein [Yinghuangia soli]MCF2529862.1 hypothetical protein [Yinghuangia soli]